MSSYDYKAGKQRVVKILDNLLKVEGDDTSGIPSESNFTYDNAYYGWVTAIFVDIRDSTTLFAQEDKEKISKIVRSFTSEIIEILGNEDKNRRSIGIRGDWVFAIYSTPSKSDIKECINKAGWINTYIKMLNKLLSNQGYEGIAIGIGVASALELVVKAGRFGSGISDSVWIGEAVCGAANLSSKGNKEYTKPIFINNCTYANITEEIQKFCIKDIRNNCYQMDVIIPSFNDWIVRGMPS